MGIGILKKIKTHKEWSISYDHETGEIEETFGAKIMRPYRGSINEIYNANGEELNTDYVKYYSERPQKWKTWEWLKSLFGEENVAKANFWQSNGYGDYIISFVSEENIEEFKKEAIRCLRMQ